MAVPVSDIVASMAGKLDANSSPPYTQGYYTFSKDYIYAIQYGVEWIVNAVISKLGNNKFSEEAVADLTKVWVFQMSSYGRINIPQNVWSIKNVYPDPTTFPTTPTKLTLAAYNSAYRDDIAFLDAPDGAANHDSSDGFYNENQDPFAEGYSLETRNINSYRWREIADYNATGAPYYVATPREIHVKPTVDFCGVELIKFPTTVTTLDDSLEFPMSMKELLVELGLLGISFKMGDGTSISGLSLSDIERRVREW